MYRGEFMDIFAASDTAKVENIGLLMAGIKPGNAISGNPVSENRPSAVQKIPGQPLG